MSEPLRLRLIVPSSSPRGKDTRVLLGDLDITQYCASIEISSSAMALNSSRVELVGLQIETDMLIERSELDVVDRAGKSVRASRPGTRLITFGSENL